jgi:hypothetical protein
MTTQDKAKLLKKKKLSWDELMTIPIPAGKYLWWWSDGTVELKDTKGFNEKS